MGVYIPNMEKPKHCGMCEFQDMCACILLREPIPYGINVLPNCPLIDIVHCGECKHGIKHPIEDVECGLTSIFMSNTDFCSYGERRADEHNFKRD